MKFIKTSRDKLILLILGIVIGFTVGIIIARLQIEKQKEVRLSDDKLNLLYEKIMEYFSPKADLAKTTEFQAGRISLICKKRNHNSSGQQDDSGVLSDSTMVNPDALDEFVGKYGNNLDSLTLDSLLKHNKDLAYNTGTDDDIVIKKDRFILSLEIPVKGLNSKEEKYQNYLDSLLTDNNSSHKSGKVKVEFWFSPINYKGYKYQGNRMILYGINPSKNINLRIINKTLFLNDNLNIYKIDPTDEFSPLKKVTSVSIIKCFTP